MTDSVEYLQAQPAHVELIANLHAESWRRTYRGMFADEFLDGDLIANRRAVWHDRLEHPTPNQFICLAMADNRAAGFICGYGAHDPKWGSFIDNLHVSADYRRRGTGTQLMRRAVEFFLSAYPEDGVFLRVMEANHTARRFYEALGAMNAETLDREVHPGHWATTCRYVWSSARDLVGAG